MLWRGLSSKCRRFHTKWEVLSPRWRLTLQNAGIYFKYHANSVVCFSAFFGLDGFASFFSFWLCKALPFFPMVLFVFTSSPQPRPPAWRNHNHCLHPKYHSINRCWCVPPDTPPPTATTAATAAARQQQRQQQQEITQYYKYNCSYKHKNFSSYNCNKNNETNKNTQLVWQQPTTETVCK